MRNNGNKGLRRLGLLIIAVLFVVNMYIFTVTIDNLEPDDIVSDGDVINEEITIEPVMEYRGDIFLLVGSSIEHVAGCTSEDDQIASCADGVISAVAPGETRISSDDGNGYCQYWNLVVSDYQSLNVPINKAQQLEVSSTDCTWSCSNSEVAVVDENGLLTPATVGTCTVTATDTEGRQYGWEVSVKRVAYLTIDDWPNDYTPKILDTLRKYDIKATFFFVGQKYYIDLYQQIIDEGHSIGNHTRSHNFDYIYASSGNFCSSVRNMEAWLMDNFGATTRLLRFPGGYNGRDEVYLYAYKKLTAEGYRVYDWTCMLDDVNYKEPEGMFQVFKDTLNEDVEVVLMHHKEGTAEVLEEVILYLYDHDYMCLPLDESCPTYDFRHGWQE